MDRMNKLLQKNYVKATNKEAGEPRYSHNWAMAKRAFYKVYSDHLEIGDWVIPFNEIKDIVLYKTKQMFIPVSVLNIQTEKENYQIGFNPWVNPIKNIPFNVRSESIRLKYSIFSIVIRAAIVAYILYWLWERNHNAL